MVVSKALQCLENVSPSSHSKVYFHCTCIQDRHGKNFEVTFHTFCRNYGARVYSECLLTGLSLIHNWSYMSVQLLIRKRKAEKFSYVFKKKKWNNQRNESDRIWNNNFPSLQLFRERLAEKVHATFPKGIVGGFEFNVFQRSLKEWHERPWTYVCEW